MVGGGLRGCGRRWGEPVQLIVISDVLYVSAVGN